MDVHLLRKHWQQHKRKYHQQKIKRPDAQGAPDKIVLKGKISFTLVLTYPKPRE
jgi:hypothetical protein